jgi:hypothetical protein
MLFPSVDSRFVLNVFFYFVGVVTVSCFDWKFNAYVKTFIVLIFVLSVAAAIHKSLLYPTYGQMALGAAGVFVILFVCEGISRLLFDGNNIQQNGFRTIACQIIKIISYASMACYMFHRFFYWAAEKIWNPSGTSVKWLFMIGCVYPLIVVFSYMIQKLYDKSIS